ncbi:MAG: hypothetical protein HWN69_04835 [Desulfobacterales bacterium]|nr:hypothetical protein [Desulfobacterales bacterium]
MMPNKFTWNSFFKKALLLIPLCVCLACAQHLTRIVPPETHPPHMTFTVLRDYNTTWNAMVHTVTGLPGHTIRSSQKKTGTIVVEPVTVVIKDYCDCGKIGETPLKGLAKRRTKIKLKPKAPQKTVVEISCKYTTTYTWKNIYGKSVRNEIIKCTSNGRFEQGLYQRLIRYLN